MWRNLNGIKAIYVGSNELLKRGKIYIIELSYCEDGCAFVKVKVPGMAGWAKIPYWDSKAIKNEWFILRK